VCRGLRPRCAFPRDQKITNDWSATTAQTGAAVTATNVAYNGSIAPGANTSFGCAGLLDRREATSPAR
jgi:Cellulose binding domain